MSEEQSNNNKWKNYLLKSSLPLEQLVSEKLQESGFQVVGKYPYIRPNEQDINTEFSIDTQARLKVEDSCIATLLVECKYNYPGIRWVFSPYPKSSFMPGDLYCLHDRQQHQLHSLSSIFIPTCTQGIALNNSGFDPDTISHGLNQLFYGMPNLIIHEALNKDIKWLAGITHSFICLLLVTTADLYILKSKQNLDSYHSAKSLDDVASKVDALIVAQEKGPHLHQYCENLLRTFIKSSTYEMDKVKQISNALIEDYSRRLLPNILPVIVINLDSFEYIMEKMKSTFNDIISKERFLNKRNDLK